MKASYWGSIRVGDVLADLDGRLLLVRRVGLAHVEAVQLTKSGKIHKGRTKSKVIWTREIGSLYHCIGFYNYWDECVILFGSVIEGR